MSNETVSPSWEGFRRLWIIISILLFILLLFMWLLGYGPGGKSCQLKPAEIVTPKVDAAKLISPDKTAPKLTFKDSSVMKIIAGQPFSDTGASALDNVDGDVSVKVSGKVDNNTPGEYELIYTATDAAGNTTSETRKVIVEAKMPKVEIAAPDKSAPVLTLNGASDVKLFVGDKFTDEGAKALDGIDGKVAVKVDGKVDAAKVGEYKLVYSAVDAAGNKASKTRVVLVQAKPDKAAPELTLSGAPNVKLFVGDKFTDEGAKALDGKDGRVAVKVDGKVDASKVGEYKLIYSAVDAAGNKASKTRVVLVQAVPDKTAPGLKLNGDSVIKIMAGTAFTDAGAKALDKIDGDVKVTVSGNVDTKTQGEYILTYTAVDAAGNKATETRNVIVEAAASAPTVLLPAPAKLYFENNSAEFPADTTLSLAGVISYLRNNSNSTAIISGFHSSTGNIARNKELSLGRSQEVVKLLLEAGIPADRMRLEVPQESEGTGSQEEARRVEVKVVN